MLEVLDARMGCDLRDTSSPFVRRVVQLIDPRVDAWVYTYAGSLPRAHTISPESRTGRGTGE